MDINGELTTVIATPLTVYVVLLMGIAPARGTCRRLRRLARGQEYEHVRAHLLRTERRLADIRKLRDTELQRIHRRDNELGQLQQRVDDLQRTAAALAVDSPELALARAVVEDLHGRIRYLEQELEATDDREEQIQVLLETHATSSPELRTWMEIEQAGFQALDQEIRVLRQTNRALEHGNGELRHLLDRVLINDPAVDPPGRDQEADPDQETGIVQVRPVGLRRIPRQRNWRHRGAVISWFARPTRTREYRAVAAASAEVKQDFVHALEALGVRAKAWTSYRSLAGRVSTVTRDERWEMVGRNIDALGAAFETLRPQSGLLARLAGAYAPTRAGATDYCARADVVRSQIHGLLAEHLTAAESYQEVEAISLPGR